jgi:hypothetical protein
MPSNHQEKGLIIKGFLRAGFPKKFECSPSTALARLRNARGLEITNRIGVQFFRASFQRVANEWPMSRDR